MQKIEARVTLYDLFDRYLNEKADDEVPNTDVGLIDDFGEWLRKYRDDL